MNRDHIETFKVYNKSTSHCLWQKKCYIFTKLLYFPPGHTGRPYFTAQLISRSQEVFSGQWNLKEYDLDLAHKTYAPGSNISASVRPLLLLETTRGKKIKWKNKGKQNTN